MANCKDITETLNSFQRGLLFFNCPHGIMIGGHCGEGVVYYRRYSSNTMKDPKHPDEIYVRTGEIFESEEGHPLTVYRLKQDIIKSNQEKSPAYV